MLRARKANHQTGCGGNRKIIHCAAHRHKEDFLGVNNTWLGLLTFGFQDDVVFQDFHDLLAPHELHVLSWKKSASERALSVIDKELTSSVSEYRLPVDYHRVDNFRLIALISGRI